MAESQQLAGACDLGVALLPSLVVVERDHGGEH
jgi:hypothetical protein